MVEKNLVELADIVFYWNVSAQPHLSFSVVRENDGKVILRNTEANTTDLGYLKVPLKTEDKLKDRASYFRY